MPLKKATGQVLWFMPVNPGGLHKEAEIGEIAI
jgi:hypothetical protein